MNIKDLKYPLNITRIIENYCKYYASVEQKSNCLRELMQYYTYIIDDDNRTLSICTTHDDRMGKYTTYLLMHNLLSIDAVYVKNDQDLEIKNYLIYTYESSFF
jgi:hypothetical protein